MAGRVAARYRVAESLTKDWLMGVRRGWLKLMDPPIGDWADVHQAYKNLALFVSRLKDQSSPTADYVVHPGVPRTVRARVQYAF